MNDNELKSLAGRLTPPQVRALRALSERPRSPAELGKAIRIPKDSDQWRPPSQQGLGLFGGSMGSRLKRMGLARDRRQVDYDCFGRGPSIYRLSADGRKVLKRVAADKPGNRAGAA